MAFLNALQKHIEKYGPIQVDHLYEAPFSNIHNEGPAGVFVNKTQYDDLINMVETFNNSKCGASLPSSN